MAESNGTKGFGEMTQEKGRLEEYEPGTWMDFSFKASRLYGKLEKVDHKKGEITFSEMVDWANTRKGYVLARKKKPTAFMISDISRHTTVTESDIRVYIMHQCIFYSEVGKYISIMVNGNPAHGRLHKIQKDHIELRPYLCFKEGKPCVEDKRSRKIKKDIVTDLRPSSKEELEFRIQDILKRMQEDKQKDSTSIIQT